MPRREQLILMVGFGLGSLAWNLCWPFLPLRVQAVGVTGLTEVARLSGLLAGGINLITAILSPVWSTIGERFGYRIQILRAHLGTMTAMSLIGLARSPLELVGAGSVLGFFGGNYPHYIGLIASRVPASEVGRIVGDLQAAGQIGGTIGPIVGGLVAASMGVPAAFLMSGAVSFSAFLLVFLTVRTAGRSTVTANPGERNLRAAFARPELRWLMLIMILGDAFVIGLRPLIPIIISARVDDPATVASLTGLTATLATAGTVLSAIVVGRLSRRVSPRAILLTTIPIAAGIAALIPFATDTATSLIAWSMLGLASGATTPALFAWLGRFGASGSGVYALLASTHMLAYALGPASMGQAAALGLDWPFWLAAVATLVAAALIAFRYPRGATAPSTPIAGRPVANSSHDSSSSAE
jgi:MFS transporter, DHA1 family, multidrug resistance protein